jgi:hypothetical protein
VHAGGQAVVGMVESLLARFQVNISQSTIDLTALPLQ